MSRETRCGRYRIGTGRGSAYEVWRSVVGVLLPRRVPFTIAKMICRAWTRLSRVTRSIVWRMTRLTSRILVVSSIRKFTRIRRVLPLRMW